MGCLRVIIAKTGDVYETSELGPKRRIQRVELFSFGFLNSTSVQFFKGTCGMGRNENGTVRERETMGYFVPDREFPTRPEVGFCSRHLPSRRTVSCSRSDCFPSRYCLPNSRLFPVLLSAQLFPSHPDVRTQFLPSRISLLRQLFPFHLPPIFSFPHHMSVDATGLCNFQCNSTVGEETGDYQYRLTLFLFHRLCRARRITQFTTLSINHSIG